MEKNIRIIYMGMEHTNIEHFKWEYKYASFIYITAKMSKLQ